MKVIRSFTPNPESCGLRTAATLGTFDGVHEGHRQLISRLIDVAHEHEVDSAVLTFNAHPLTVIRPEAAPKILTTLDEKLAHFEALGIDRVFVLEFTGEIARMTSGSFIERYLVHCLGISYFIVGYDHHFGNDKMRSANRLEEYANKYGFAVEVIRPVIIDGEEVKSSGIRDMIAAGKVSHASRMLSETYSFTGKVIRGRGKGRELGFPTANIEPYDHQKIVPGDGVYAGWAEIDGEHHDAVITIGPIPTFGLTEHLIEAHMPGIDRNLYNKEIRVGFIERIRDVVKFRSENELIGQIASDIKEANRIITK